MDFKYLTGTYKGEEELKAAFGVEQKKLVNKYYEDMEVIDNRFTSSWGKDINQELVNKQFEDNMDLLDEEFHFLLTKHYTKGITKVSFFILAMVSLFIFAQILNNCVGAT